jgi:hypothetical protein
MERSDNALGLTDAMKGQTRGQLGRRTMKRIVAITLAAVAFGGGFGTYKWLQPAHAGQGHQVDVVCTSGCYEIGPAPGDVTVDGWTWGA